MREVPLLNLFKEVYVNNKFIEKRSSTEKDNELVQRTNEFVDKIPVDEFLDGKQWGNPILMEGIFLNMLDLALRQQA